MIGETIGHYRITAKLGEGGMGEVYRAADTRLGREVALKVLPDTFAHDADRMARFAREAQVLAALNHPNIAQIYGVEDRALVMELVAGDNLRGPVPTDTALAYARQIAEALDAAHEKGIVHRDLKPGNIKVTPQGVVKVLDFGLAKAADAASSHDTQNSPTLTISPTRAGVILGTAAYMSPEQARGKPVDKRADIWAFGCVLYELLTGKPAFEGETVSDILAAIIAREPVLDGLPAHLRPIVARCLRQDPRLRWRDIGDVRIALDEVNPAAPAVPTPRRRLWTVAAAAVAAGLALGWMVTRRQPSTGERTLNFSINPPPGESFQAGPGGGSAISPDGHTLAFVASSNGVVKLWTRRLDTASGQPLPGTDSAQFPFWSPDSRSLGFFAAGKLKRIDLSGGPPVDLADAPTGRGGAWNSTGTIIFARHTLSPFERMPAAGGPATALTALDRSKGEATHRWPQFLPDGKRFIYFMRSSQPHGTGIYLGSLDRPREKTQLAESASAGAYYPPNGKRGGYLLWLRGDSLVAQPFDTQRGQLTGELRAVPGAGSISSNTGFNLADFSVSRDGTLVFTSGTNRYQLAWFSRDGRALGTVGRPERYTSVRLSPDGALLALSTEDSSGARDLWALELAREISSRLTNSKDVLMAFWSRDSKRVVYFGVSGPNIFARNANGGGDEEVLLKSTGAIYANDFSPDGQYLLYEQVTDKGSDLTLLPMRGERKAIPYISGPAVKLNGQFSPDGKWVAYTSDESGQFEVYVQSFPAAGSKWLVSSAGGNFPRWRADGKEIVYRSLDGMLMAVAVTPDAKGLKFDAPARLFRIVTPIGPHPYTFDIARDGQKILALAPAQGAGDTQPLTVMVNWEAKLQDQGHD